MENRRNGSEAKRIVFQSKGGEEEDEIRRK